MTLSEALAALEQAGTAQNRKVYARHGVQPPCFGVSYAVLGKLKKQVRQDHGLALSLWRTGNHDARVLATMIADPAAPTAKDLDAWAKEVANYPLADAFANMVAQSPRAESRLRAWTKAKAEYVSTTGWNLLRLLARKGALSEDYLLKAVETIAGRIHHAPNYTRYAMNGALITIGGLGGALEKAALAAAKRIGKVEVDHGETGCQTPDAASYIAKTRARKRA